jgi:L-ascorbate metabolism protein UlaG (beta-lactamase superfamily)
MQISWHGGSTVELSHKKAKAILNPDAKMDLKNFQVVLYDKTDEKHEKGSADLMVDWPGEYDVSGFIFQAVESHVKKPVIAYTFFSPQGNVSWLGEMNEYPSDEFIEELGEVHVLIVPVGGKDVLNAKDAYRLVEALEPLVVIPICYGEDREGLSAFLKEMDVKMPEPKKSYEFKKTELSAENMELVLLEV